MAQRARALGYRALAIELDDYGNASRWPQVRDACYAHGMKAGIWTTEGANIAATPHDADFAIAEHEGPGDYDGIVSAIEDGAVPECPVAVLTNFAMPLGNAQGYYPDAAAPLIEAGFACLTEVYTGDNPNLTKDRLEFTATVKLGFPGAQPVYGIYNYPLPEDAEGGYGIYLLEYAA